MTKLAVLRMPATRNDTGASGRPRHRPEFQQGGWIANPKRHFDGYVGLALKWQIPLEVRSRTQIGGLAAESRLVSTDKEVTTAFALSESVALGPLCLTGVLSITRMAAQKHLFWGSAICCKLALEGQALAPLAEKGFWASVSRKAVSKWSVATGEHKRRKCGTPHPASYFGQRSGVTGFFSSACYSRITHPPKQNSSIMVLSNAGHRAGGSLLF